jgi:hypothetical protein
MFLLLIHFYFIPPAIPCAPAPLAGQQLLITKEEALIIWDGKTQHFIRRGAFKSDADNFGFIVPSPTLPKLEEVDDSILFKLYQKTKAKYTRKDRWRPNLIPLLAYTFLYAGDSAPEKSIVVDLVKVAGMDAAVLKAENGDVLGNWLMQNNYPFSPELKEWAQHYIEKGWYLTAFKIDKGSEKTPVVESKLVHMQFESKRPFFPYKEPKSTKSSLEGSRTLRIYMISEQPPTPKIGDGSTVWKGKVVYAKEGDFGSLFKDSSLQKLIPKNAWLSEIEDSSNPRPGTDELWLDANSAPETIERQPIVVERKRSIPVPLDVVLIIVGIGFWLFKKKNAFTDE